MLKYTETQVGFSEVPEEITLCLNISNCPIHCNGCHSMHLWEDIGEELGIETLSSIIVKNTGITCVAFMGGDNSPEDIYTLAQWVKNNTKLKTCWYSGNYLRKDFPKEYFDYLKTGPYNAELGGLDKETTNQRFYEIRIKEIKNSNLDVIDSYRYLEDITWKFQKPGEIHTAIINQEELD